jgi:hypothetical protein
MKNLQSYDEFLNEFEKINLKDLHPDEDRIMDLKKGDKFDYLGINYEVIDPKKRHAKRISDEKEFKITPFTWVKKIN